ncbi:MAG: YHS domain-containing protein [Pseudomonadota bacterium]
MRLFFYLAVAFVVYQIYKGMRSVSQSSAKKSPQRPDVVTAELVEDPVCHIYFPKNQALTIDWKGKTCYFCSTECREKFLDLHKPA